MLTFMLLNTIYSYKNFLIIKLQTDLTAIFSKHITYAYTTNTDINTLNHF